MESGKPSRAVLSSLSGDDEQPYDHIAYDAVQSMLESLLIDAREGRANLADLKSNLNRMTMDISIRVTDAAVESRLTASQAADVAGFASNLAVSFLKDIRRLALEGRTVERITRRGPTGIDVLLAPARDITTKRRAVSPDMKREMADLARAGVSLSDLSAQYGYPQPDLVKILKSAGVKVAVPPVVSAPPVEPRQEIRQLGLSGIEQDVEIEIADGLLNGESVDALMARTGATAEQIEAVRTAWKVASPTEAVAAMVAAAQAEEAAVEEVREDVERFRRKPPIKIMASEEDLTRLGEELIFDGGEFGFRVEVLPDMSKRISKDLDALRTTTATRRGGVTEYELLFTNIRRYAERDMPETAESRYKRFGWRGTTIHELKGANARLFFVPYKSVYPDGREVWRVGLLHCFMKKRNEAADSDLDRAVDLEERWLAWRRNQDALISAEMLKRGKGGRRR